MKMLLVTLLLAGISFAIPTYEQANAGAKPVNSKQPTHFAIDTVLINDWIDNIRLQGVLENDLMFKPDLVRIDRDFREYLVMTEDRERTERRHSED